MVYELFADGDSVYSYQGDLSISHDEGKSWVRTLNGKVIKNIFATGNNVYVVTDQGTYYSFDSGNSWSTLYVMIDYETIDSKTITSVFESMGNIYVGLNNGKVAVSLDGGHYFIDSNFSFATGAIKQLYLKKFSLGAIYPNGAALGISNS